MGFLPLANPQKVKAILIGFGWQFPGNALGIPDCRSGTTETGLPWLCSIKGVTGFRFGLCEWGGKRLKNTQPDDNMLI
jgi:hypothetical protein